MAFVFWHFTLAMTALFFLDGGFENYRNHILHSVNYSNFKLTTIIYTCIKWQFLNIGKFRWFETPTICITDGKKYSPILAVHNHNLYCICTKKKKTVGIATVESPNVHHTWKRKRVKYRNHP